jgi:ribonuclease-3
LQSSLDELERALGYHFANRALLARAVTHSSSANESQPPAAQPLPPDVQADNERLEFLGDAVLGLIVSEALFDRFKDFAEGQLSLLKNHLVSATHLLDVAHRLELGRYLQLGRGEETAGGRSKQRLLVNAFEAVLAAVYLDAGFDTTRELLLRHVMPPDEELAQLAGSGPPHDFRAELERLARDRKLPRPHFVIVSETGPGHARAFTVEARAGKDYVAVAEGSSKKAAAHNAARRVCELIREALAKASPA